MFRFFNVRFGLPSADAGHGPSCVFSGGGIWLCMAMAVCTQTWWSDAQNKAHTNPQRILTKRARSCSPQGGVSLGVVSGSWPIFS